VVVEGGAVPEGAVLFVDPASASGAVSLLAQLGESSGPVHVALPDGTDPDDLVREPGVLRVGDAPRRIDYALYRPGRRSAADRDLLSSAPEVAEAPDVLERREDWFRKRSGGAGDG
jgi:hypothetical protein